MIHIDEYNAWEKKIQREKIIKQGDQQPRILRAGPDKSYIQPESPTYFSQPGIDKFLQIAAFLVIFICCLCNFVI